MDEAYYPALEAAFEAIKAKHKGIHARFSPQSDPLLLELADMILLFSAQLTLAAATPANREPAPKGKKAEAKPKHILH
jgi:hypothetical protein